MRLKSKDKKDILQKLTYNWQRSRLAAQGFQAEFEIKDFTSYLRQDDRF